MCTNDKDQRVHAAPRLKIDGTEGLLPKWCVNMLVRRTWGRPTLARCRQSALALVLLAHGGTAVAAEVAAATNPNTVPHALWIPELPLGSGKTAQTGAWLLVGTDNKPLRGADIRSIQNYVTQPDGKILPTVASDATGLFGYLDATGQWAVTPQFQSAKAFTPDGLARVQRKGLWGFLGTDLSLRIPHQFVQADGFANGMAAVMVKDKWGFIDTTGAIVVTPKYRMVWRYGKNGLARVAVDKDKYGFVDRKGNMVIAPQFDLALEFGNAPVTAAKRKGLWGVIDGEGRWVNQPTFPQLDAFQEPGIAAFEADSRVGFIDKTARVVIPPGPHSRLVRQGLVLHGERGGSDFRFIDTQGKTAIAGPFDWSHDFSAQQPWVVARHKGVWGVLQRNGTWVAAGPGREPMLTDSDNHFASRPLSMWVHAGHAIEWKNAQGQTLYRLSERASQSGKSHVWQLHATNQLVWTSPPQKNRLQLPVFFEPSEADVSEVPDNNWTGLAKKLLAQKFRPYLPYSLVFGGQRDPYDLQSIEDDDDREDVKQGAFAVLAQTYVDEMQWGQYYFLDSQRSRLFKTLETNICAALRGEWGAPINTGKPGTVLRDEGDLVCEWKLGDKTLTVTHFQEFGDGDFEHQIRMVVTGPAPKPASVKKSR
jgi:WG containing repeat